MFHLRSVSKWFRRGARRTSKSGKARRFRPTLETLECRLTPATGVTTSMVDGTLTITDTAAKSSLTLSQPAANEITITPDAGTTINGKAGPVTISGVTGGLNINLGTGNDNVTFDLSKHNIDVGSVSISGSGSETVLTNAAGTTNFLNVHGDYTESFGSGFDFTTLHQFHVGGNMKFTHANGDSLVFLGVDHDNLGKLFDSVKGNLTAENITSSGRVGSGFDVDALEETNVGGDIKALMGTGDSTGFAGWTSVGSLSSKSISVAGDVKITGPSGFLAFGDFANDGEEVVNAHVAGTVTMDLGSGAGNTALFGNGTSATSTSAGNLFISGTGTHDTVTLGPSTIHGNLNVSLSHGGNSISLDDVSVAKDTVLTTLGGGNSVAIDNQIEGSTFGGSVGIFMGGADNVLEINSHTTGSATTTFDGLVMASLGTGNDTLILAQAGNVDFKAASTFFGGMGKNRAFVNHGNIQGVQPTLLGF